MFPRLQTAQLVFSPKISRTMYGTLSLIKWTAVLYFKHRNGTYKRVPIYPNAQLDTGVQGGMTIYYTQKDFNTNGNAKITAFKPVSRLPLARTTQRLTLSLGFPYDRWESNNRYQRSCSQAHRSAIHLLADCLDKRCRDTRLPSQALPSWYHGYPSLPSVGYTIQSLL